MKIVISGKAFVKKYRTGVQRYCNEKFNYKNIKVVKYGKLNLNFWEQIELPLYALKNKCVLVNLCNTSPLLNPGIVCVHDLNCIKNHQYYPKIFSIWYKIMIGNAIKKAKKIITVSKFSKKEIEDFYHIKDAEVVYNSYEHIEKIKSDNRIFDKIKNIVKNDYFFTLGTVQKNKNIQWIIEVAKKHHDETFVITGYKNQKIDIDLNNVIYTGYLKDEEIKALMKYCKAYIMPSFYEGFGLPPIEAFSLGKDIIVSDIPVMHEIFEDNVQYIKPNNYDINFNKIVHTKNKEKILNKFSWENSANKLLEIINQSLE